MLGYASLACYSDPDRVRAAVRQAVDARFSAVKLHESTMAAIHAARDEAAPDVELIVDAGCPWTLTQALALVEELRDIDQIP